jgi:hypothetical protein
MFADAEAKLARFLYSKRKVSDTQAGDDLKRERTLLQRCGIRREELPPKQLSTAWDWIGFQESHSSKVRSLVYCPLMKKSLDVLVCGKLLPQNHGTGECKFCLHEGRRTATHNPHRFKTSTPIESDTVFDAEQQYRELMMDSTFVTALRDYWPKGLEMLQVPLEDDSAEVGPVLSGTSARRLYRDYPAYFKMDISEGGEATIVVRRLSDYQEPYHGTSIQGQFSTGGDNDEIVNISHTLVGRPEYNLITHIINGGKHIKNPVERQKYCANEYHGLMHDGIKDVKVATSGGVVTLRLLRIIIVHYAADSPKLAQDQAIMDQPSPGHLNFALEGFAPIRISKRKLCWCLSFNLGAKVRSEASADQLAKEVQDAIGTSGYKALSQKNGFKGQSAWVLGDMPHLSLQRGVCLGWDHIGKITTTLVRNAIMRRMPAKLREVLIQRQLAYRAVRGGQAPRSWAVYGSCEKIKDMEDWVLRR